MEDYTIKNILILSGLTFNKFKRKDLQFLRFLCVDREKAFLQNKEAD